MFHNGEFAPQYRQQKIATAARRFEEAGVNALGLVFNQLQHGFHHPRRGEDLAVVCDALF
jgi:hypothetical protein